VSSLERSPTAPDVPAVSETLKGFEATSWHGVFVPAGTPRPVVDKLNAEVRRIMELPDVQAKLKEIGAVPSPMSPEQFQEFIKTERAKWGDVVKTAGVSAN
jgi:tripartite-type tricarboxylate transporter receptor subunit TctC